MAKKIVAPQVALEIKMEEFGCPDRFLIKTDEDKALPEKNGTPATSMHYWSSLGFDFSMASHLKEIPYSFRFKKEAGSLNAVIYSPSPSGEDECGIIHFIERRRKEQGSKKKFFRQFGSLYFQKKDLNPSYWYGNDTPIGAWELMHSIVGFVNKIMVSQEWKQIAAAENHSVILDFHEAPHKIVGTKKIFI